MEILNIVSRAKKEKEEKITNKMVKFTHVGKKN